MGNQRRFASLAWNGKGKVTRRERFLAEMDAVIPWSRLVRLIEPHYPKAGQGRQPPLETSEGAARRAERVTAFAAVLAFRDIGQRRDTHTATMRTGCLNL